MAQRRAASTEAEKEAAQAKTQDAAAQAEVQMNTAVHLCTQQGVKYLIHYSSSGYLRDDNMALQALQCSLEQAQQECTALRTQLAEHQQAFQTYAAGVEKVGTWWAEYGKNALFLVQTDCHNMWTQMARSQTLQ
jgi:hypothetical protein